MWLARGDESRTVRMEIDGDVLELSEATAADQDRLIGCSSADTSLHAEQ